MCSIYLHPCMIETIFIWWHKSLTIAGMKITTILLKFWGSFPFFARVIDPIYTPSTPQEIQEIKLLKGTFFSQTITFRVHVSFPGSTAFVFEILRMLPSWINMANSLSQWGEMCIIPLFFIKLIRIIVTSHILKQRYLYNAPAVVWELLQIHESVFYHR